MTPKWHASVILVQFLKHCIARDTPLPIVNSHYKRSIYNAKHFALIAQKLLRILHIFVADFAPPNSQRYCLTPTIHILSETRLRPLSIVIFRHRVVTVARGRYSDSGRLLYFGPVIYFIFFPSTKFLTSLGRFSRKFSTRRSMSWNSLSPIGVFISAPNKF